jgi:hypothetical protein
LAPGYYWPQVAIVTALLLVGSALAQPGWEWVSPDLAYVEEVDPFTDEVLRYAAAYGWEVYSEREAPSSSYAERTILTSS